MSEFGTPQPDDNYESPARATTLFFHAEEADFWRLARKERYDESNRALSIVPLIKSGERHDVAWLERSRRNSDTGETVVMHQAACKCIAKSEFEGDIEMSAMQDCDAWKAGLIQRALQINHQTSLDLGQMYNLAMPLFEATQDGWVPPADLGLDPVDEAMMVYLKSVSKTPSYWAGNIKGGSHELPLLSVVTGFQFDHLSEHAHSLAKYGWIEFDGEQTVRLAA
jgi:hypothetical protein